VDPRVGSPAVWKAPPLSARERDAMRLMDEGLTTEAIAATLEAVD
jgi:DNA-binding CsgD family transcriptional regulator